MVTLSVRADEVRAAGRILLEGPASDVLVVWADGGFHAIDDACRHRGLSLSQGVIRECVITCPAHLWRYNVRTGARHDEPGGEPQASYVTRVVPTPAGDIVEVDAPEPEAPLRLRDVLLAHARSARGPRPSP